MAQNLALDAIRHDALSREKVEELRRWTREEQAGASSPDTAVEESPQDDTLRMLLLCCHEALPRESRLALTLKTVAGFGVEEIARALLVRPSAVAQRLVRAKRRLRKCAITSFVSR